MDDTSVSVITRNEYPLPTEELIDIEDSGSHKENPLSLHFPTQLVKRTHASHLLPLCSPQPALTFPDKPEHLIPATPPRSKKDTSHCPTSPFSDLAVETHVKQASHSLLSGAEFTVQWEPDDPTGDLDCETAVWKDIDVCEDFPGYDNIVRECKACGYGSKSKTKSVGLQVNVKKEKVTKEIKEKEPSGEDEDEFGTGIYIPTLQPGSLPESEKSYPVRDMYLVFGLTSRADLSSPKEKESSWRFRDKKRSLWQHIKKEQVDFINSLADHQCALLTRLPAKMKPGEFAKRVLILGFHFVLRDGKLPTFWEKLDAPALFKYLDKRDKVPSYCFDTARTAHELWTCENFGLVRSVDISVSQVTHKLSQRVLWTDIGVGYLSPLSTEDLPYKSNASSVTDRQFIARYEKKLGKSGNAMAPHKFHHLLIPSSVQPAAGAALRRDMYIPPQFVHHSSGQLLQLPVTMLPDDDEYRKHYAGSINYSNRPTRLLFQRPSLPHDLLLHPQQQQQQGACDSSYGFGTNVTRKRARKDYLASYSAGVGGDMATMPTPTPTAMWFNRNHHFNDFYHSPLPPAVVNSNVQQDKIATPLVTDLFYKTSANNFTQQPAPITSASQLDAATLQLLYQQSGYGLDASKRQKLEAQDRHTQQVVYESLALALAHPHPQPTRATQNMPNPMANFISFDNAHVSPFIATPVKAAQPGTTVAGIPTTPVN